MSEIAPELLVENDRGYRLLSAEDTIEVLPEVLEGLHATISPEKRPITKAFYGAMRTALDDPFIHDIVAAAIRVRFEERTRPVPPLYIAHLLMRHIQRPLMNLPRRYGYPEEFTTEERWYKGIMDVMERRDAPPSPGSLGVFIYDMGFRDNSSNQEARYKQIKLILQALLRSGRLSTEAVGIDVGVSQFLGDKAMLLDNHPWHLQVMANTESDSIDLPTTRIVDAWLASKLMLKRIIGVDLWPRDDPDTAQSAESCTFYPEELRSRSRVVNYLQLLLTHKVDDKLGFIWADFANPDTDLSPELGPQEKADFAILSGVMYEQNTVAKKVALLRETIRRVKKNGLIIAQDFVHIKKVPGTPARMVFPEDIYAEEWMFRTLVLDLMQADAGWQELFCARNGRSEEVVMRDGRLIVDASQSPKTMPDILGRFAIAA